MFAWLKKATEKINPPSLFDKVKKYLEENAPDILENYIMTYHPSEILNSYIQFENKFYNENKKWTEDNTFGFRLRDISGNIISEYSTLEGCGAFTKTYISDSFFESDMKKIDTFFEKLRNIDKEFKECFAEARKYFDALNDNGLKGFNFSINCYEGKVDNITVVPGNFKKFLEFVKPQLNTEKEFEEYEEYCYKRFKLESASNYDAYTPAVAMDVPDTWRETLSEQEKIDNDPEYISVNENCKDVLERIKNTTIDKQE